MGNDLQIYLDRLLEDFPNLQIRTVKLIGSGWHHDAVEVNGEIIFRMPRFDHESDITDASVGYETAVLALLQGRLGVAIPEPHYIAKDMSYFGYPKLRGELLADQWHNLNMAEQDAIIAQWVEVVANLHQTIDVTTARQVRVPLFSNPGETKDGAAGRIYDVQGLDPIVYAFADSVLAQSADIDVAGNQDTLIHNDLHFRNMLIDPDTHRLVGVIDWTDLCIGPLEREFCAWEWEHDNSIEKATKGYERLTGRKVNLAEARFWKHIETISDIVEAAESNDQEKIRDCVEHIRYWHHRG